MTEVFYDPSELIEHHKLGGLAIITYNETQEHILTNENSTLVSDIQKLVVQNQELGGHELGFYFGNELFAVGPTAGIGGIGPIHDDLSADAAYVAQNRKEARQDMTHMANMLSVLSSLTQRSYLMYLANIPIEFIQFSSSIKRLAAYADKHSPGWADDFNFADSPTYDAYNLHLQRVEPKLKRYLFRQLVS